MLSACVLVIGAAAMLPLVCCCWCWFAAAGAGLLLVHDAAAVREAKLSTLMARTEMFDQSNFRFRAIKQSRPSLNLSSALSSALSSDRLQRAGSATHQRAPILIQSTRVRSSPIIRQAEFRSHRQDFEK